MIITVNEFLNCGLTISDEITDDKLERAIKTAEQFVIKPRLGDYYYPILENENDEYDTVIDGGAIEISTGNYIYLSGLKEAEFEIAYACLLRENIAATTFGSVVKKNEEYSDAASEERLNAVARYHTEIGMAYLKEITDYLNIDNSSLHLNNWFEELI